MTNNQFHIHLPPAHPIRIHHRYPNIRALCEEYLCDDDVTPDVIAMTDDGEIEAERAVNEYPYSDGMLEALCLHRAMVKGLVKFGVILIHSAVVAVDGEAYVFIAPSGVGKSTHLRQWMTHFGDRAVIVNGDKPLFAFEDDRLIAYGSPFRGKEGWGSNTSAPVKAICILERGEINVCRPATVSEAVGKLFGQVLMPDNATDLAVFMPMLDRIVREVPFYHLQCTISEEAAVVAYQEMSKGATL